MHADWLGEMLRAGYVVAPLAASTPEARALALDPPPADGCYLATLRKDGVLIDVAVGETAVEAVTALRRRAVSLQGTDPRAPVGGAWLDDVIAPGEYVVTEVLDDGGRMDTLCTYHSEVADVTTDIVTRGGAYFVRRKREDGEWDHLAEPGLPLQRGWSEPRG